MNHRGHGRFSIGCRVRPGFTLMEVLISIALILALFGAMFGFLNDMLTTRVQVLELTSQQRAASLLIDRVESDLLTSLVGNARWGTGVKGDESSLRLLVRGAAPGVHGEMAFGDLQQAEYRFDPDTHRLTGSRAAAGDDAAETHQIGERLYRVRFRYHDGEQWVDQFDSIQLDRLPLAVEVAVWFEPWPGEQWNEVDDLAPSTVDGSAGLERASDQMEPTFDESQWAMRADRDFRDDPIPDRVRIIAIPDAAGGSDE